MGTAAATQPTLTRRGARRVDRLAAERYGMASILLMENAAIHSAGVAAMLLHGAAGRRVLVVCGPGNNGGDGLAVARHLHNAGARVAVVISARRGAYRCDAGANLRIVRRMKLPLTEAGAAPARALARAAARLGGVDLVVDALLGTGLDRPVSGTLVDLIAGVNRIGDAGAKVLSLDIPSGMDADTGRALGDAVRADVTVTFAATKRGFLAPGAPAYTGRVIVAGIGVPAELVSRAARV